MLIPYQIVDTVCSGDDAGGPGFFGSTARGCPAPGTANIHAQPSAASLCVLTWVFVRVGAYFLRTKYGASPNPFYEIDSYYSCY